METFLVEEVIMQKEAPKKKYKCPYCDERYERAKLHIHIQNKHEDLIPEGYTALRVAFNTINNKTEGHCIICKGVTDWNEDKGRYERLCNNPACKEAYKKMIAERYNRIYGTDRLQTDPQYAEYVQRKALEGRKMSGKYKFEDGGEVNYMGTYEKKFLMFMDTVMHCKSEDIIAPGPSIKYMWEGKEHLYLPDYYYEPYNLIIEIKDGGSNPNTHSKRLGEEAQRIAAKEAGVKKDGHFNYVRVTNNDFGQLLQIMSVLKYQMKHPYYYTEPVFRINESVLFNEEDIYYNKDKFDSGEINLCFVTGASGSGKSTMTRGQASETTEVIELDDLSCVKDKCSYDELKKRGNLLYSYFNGIGKKFYLGIDDLKEVPVEDYEQKLFPEFINYAKNYAKSHKDKKFIIEGVQLLGKLDFNLSPVFRPEDFKDYAFYIKGTSMLVSKIRAAKRDNENEKNKVFKIARRFVLKYWKWCVLDEKLLNQYRRYFKGLMKSTNEAAEESIIPYFSSDVALLDFMKKNIKYKNFTKLMSAEDVFEQKKGSCHDQVMFELYCLRRLGYKPTATFLIEYKDGESEGGVTHSFVTYKKDNKVCWFENAWEGQEGIHKFDSSKAVKDKILELHKEGKFGNNTKYPEVEFSSFGKHEPGETLDDFVNKCLNESMVSEDMSGTIGAALPLTPSPVPFEAQKSNYFVVMHPQNNVFNYSITKDPLQHKLFTVDSENPGFYNVVKSDKGKISKKYLTFKIKDSQKAKELYDELEKIEEHGGWFHDEVHENYIYEKLTEGSKLLDPEQILFDDRFELVRDFDAQLKEDCDNLYRWLMPTPMELLEHHMTLLEDWYTDGLQDYNVLPDNIDNLADLNEWKYRFYSMPHDQQRKGDDLSIDLYGDTNFNRYNKKYAKLINQISPDIDEPEVVKDTLGYITGLAEVASETEVLVSYDEWDLKMEKCRQAERDGLLIMIDTDGEKVEEYTADAIAKLKQKYAALQNMNPDKRVLSNQTASNILGLDNENLYSRILTAYLNRIDNINPKDIEDVTNRDDEVITAVSANAPTPYYTPDNTEFVSAEKHPEDQYTQAESAQLRDLTMLLKFTHNPEKRKALKEQICELGWNPELPYNVEKANYTYLRYKSFSGIQEIDATGLAEAVEEQKKIINGSVEDIQKMLDSIPKSDSEYGQKHKEYKETIYRNVVPMKGFIELYKSKDGEGIATVAIIVHPDSRGEGLGTKLVKSAQSAMGSLGIDRIEWYCKRSNEASKKLAEKCGFKVDDSLCNKEWYTLYYGKTLDEKKKAIKEADEAISQAKYTSEQLKDKIVPVFVILTHNVLLRSKAIMWFTDSDYSHVSIAFDSSLDEMYTYTIGIDNAPNKKHKTGFAVDTIAKYKKFDPHMKTKIYALFVTPEQKAMMQDAVQWYIDNQDNTAYGFGTILNIVLRRPTKSKDGDKCKMVCSQFVYTILKLAEFKMKKTKDSSLVSPGDIDELSDDARFYVVFQDGIDKYDKKKVDKICYKLLPTLPLEMYGINEATGVELYRPKSAIRKLDEINRVFKMAEEILN